MSAITKPYVHSGNATGGEPVAIENILTFFKRDLPVANVLNPSNPVSNNNKYQIVFVENSVSPGRKEIVWTYSDSAVRDTDFNELKVGLSVYFS